MAIFTFEEALKKGGVKAEDVKTVAPQTSATMQAENPSLFSRIKTDITTAGEKYNQAIAGEGQFAGHTIPTRAVEATAQAFNAIPKVGSEILPEIARKGMSYVGNVFSKIINATGAGLADVGEALSNVEAYSNFVNKFPTVRDTLEKIGEDVFSQGAAAGQISGDILAADQFAKNAQKGVDLTKEVVKPILEKTGSATSFAGDKVYKSAFDLTTQEAEQVQNYKIKLKFLKEEQAKLDPSSSEYANLGNQIDSLKAPVTRADTGLQKGIMGTEKQIGVQSGVDKMDLWKNKVKPALENSDVIMTKDELFAKAAQTVANEADLTRKAMLQNAYEALQEDYANFQGADLLKMNQIKTSLAKFTPSKIFRGQEVASGVKTLQADMASAIREKTYSSLDPSIRGDYIDYGNLKQLEKVGIKALTEAGTKGGFGGFWSTIYDKVTTPIKTVGGQVLYRVGNKLEFWGRKGIKTVGQYLDENGIIIKKP